MNAATPLTVSSDWNGIRLRAFGKKSLISLNQYA